MKLKLPIIAILLITTANINAAHHEEDDKLAAQGLISSEVFDLAGEMDLYVEKYASCGASKAK